jgi:hypothetical protein
MSDFRYLYQADFEAVLAQEEQETLSFILRAVKPSRITTPVGA